MLLLVSRWSMDWPVLPIMLLDMFGHCVVGYACIPIHACVPQVIAVYRCLRCTLAWC
jgi:hypothetical protein